MNEITDILTLNWMLILSLCLPEISAFKELSKYLERILLSECSCSLVWCSFHNHYLQDDKVLGLSI